MCGNFLNFKQNIVKIWLILELKIIIANFKQKIIILFSIKIE